MIMDAYTVRYDGERSVDDVGRSNEVRDPIDERQRRVKRNGSITNEFTLTKGYLSEYFIATTLYDLWDSSSNLALRPNSPLNATSTGTSSLSGSANPFLTFDDDNPSNAFRPVPTTNPQGFLDEAGLSFADLTAPIRSHPGNGIWGVGQFSPVVIQDITEYFRFLLQVHGDCEERRQFANVFLINRISDFPRQLGVPATAPTQRLGSDEIQRAVTMTEPVFGYEDKNRAFYPDGTATFTVNLDRNELAGPADSYNLAATTATGTGSLSDALTVRAGARLGINSGAERGYGGSGQYAPGGSSFGAELCSRMRLTVAQDGRLELGNTQGNTATAALGDGGLTEVQQGGTVRVGAGSVLTIRRGATLVVRSGGSLVVDGQVRVESGAFICVETGASLASELYIDPAATLGTNPALNIPSAAGCSGRFALCGRLTGGNANVVNTGAACNEALQFDGTNDIVTIPNVNSWVNHSLTQQFAVEAFIRVDNLSTTGAQTIFSSRHRTSTGGYDGILLSLYNGGQLLLQLNGVNYYAAATQVPNDNGCHHVAVTRDNTNRVRFYIDGRETTYLPTSTYSARSAGSLNLGGDNMNNNTTYGEYFRGLIGEVRVWNWWRSGDQIRQNATIKLNAPQDGLVVYYDMQNPTGSQALSDLSGVNNTGQPLVPGVLGATSAASTDDPAWVSAANLTCTVQGNFRTGPVSWTAADSTAMPGVKPPKEKDKDKNKYVAELSVSPNPATGSTTLHFEQLKAGPVRVWVQDQLGTERALVLKETKLAAGPQNLAVSVQQLPPGLYIVVVQSSGEQEHIRLQVN